MNKRLFVGLFISLIIAGTLFVMYSEPDEAPAPLRQTTGTEQTPEALAGPGNQTESASSLSGVYADYSTEAVSNANNQVVLFFHASWCPQCRDIEQDIVSNGAPAGYTILKVDYDTNRDLRQKYGVTLQTTFVKINTAGTQTVDNYVAYNEPTLAAVVRDYLKP